MEECRGHRERGLPPRACLRVLRAALLALGCLGGAPLSLAGCLQEHHGVVARVYQNGRLLGEWELHSHPPQRPLFVLPDGGRLIVEPADGINVGTLWFRAGAVLFEATEVSP